MGRTRTNMAGKKFGKWNVVERVENSDSGKVRHRCQCDCGEYRIVGAYYLKTGKSLSCGCYRREYENLIGRKFERLTVISLNEERTKQEKRNVFYYNCLCDCGNISIVQASSLKNGRTKSCGCYSNEKKSERVSKEFGLASFNRIFSGYKANAKSRGYEFNISKEYFINIINKNCYYCGAEPSNTSKNTCNNGDYIYNGIDRIDSSIGYTEENTVPCCGMCNISKRHHSQKEFLNWVKRIYNFQCENSEEF